MQFQIPQFIDIEDKIFGPLTWKQFVYLLGGGGVSFILWRALPGFIAIILILPILGFALALSFYRFNNRPFIALVESGWNYLVSTRLYIWKKAPKKKDFSNKPKLTDTSVEPNLIPRLSNSKLKDLSWSLDILDTSKKY